MTLKDFWWDIPYSIQETDTFLERAVISAYHTNKCIQRRCDNYKITLEEISGQLSKYGAKLVYKTSYEHKFLSSETYAEVYPKPGYIRFDIASMDQALIEYLDTLPVHELPKESTAGQLYAMSMTDRLDMVQLCTVTSTLAEEGYSKENIAMVDNIIADLNSATPRGCLSILSGVPGTGKTYLIRHIIQEANCFFVLVPPEMLKAMGSPNILPLILKLRAKYARPVVFILEDCDDCLVPRKSSDMNQISAMLNLSDGMLGAALDIRIIASTNALIEEFEPALIRPGRLNYHVVTKELDAEQAQRFMEVRVSQGLDRSKVPSGISGTLAELCQTARDCGWVLPSPANL